jgi:hypothetical protein
MIVGTGGGPNRRLESTLQAEGRSCQCRAMVADPEDLASAQNLDRSIPQDEVRVPTVMPMWIGAV